MRRWRGWIVAGAVAALAAGCGGSEDEELAQSSARLDACSPSAGKYAIEWPAGSKPETTQCAGPWEYAKHVQPCWVGGTSDPSGAVCGPSGSYDQTTCASTCTNPAFGAAGYTTATITGTATSAQVCEVTGYKTQCYWDCLLLPGNCQKICDEIPITSCHTEYSCNYGTQVDAFKASYPEPYRSAIVWAPGSASNGCVGTLSNVPTGWKSGTN